MFTDRFIKVPIRLFDVQQSELTGKESYECDCVDSFKFILPMRIESYEAAMPASEGFGKDKQIATSVTMQSGETFLGFIHIDEFEKLLNSHS